MFKNTFSFEGRIRRTEYGISLIIYFALYAFILGIIKNGNSGIGLAIIPMLWFLWAQGAKRCHDMGRSGWYQIIPFYILWMIFSEGDSCLTNYGENPKGESSSQHNIKPVNFVSTEQQIKPVIDEDLSIKNNVTNMEVRNVSYSNFQDILRQLRNITIVKSLNNSMLDSTGSITITHDNTTEYLSNEFIKMIDGVNILEVKAGTIIIKLK